MLEPVLEIYFSAAYYFFFLLILVPGYVLSLMPGYVNTLSRLKKWLNYSEQEALSSFFRDTENLIARLIDYVAYGALFLFISFGFWILLFVVPFAFGWIDTTNSYQTLAALTFAEYVLLALYCINKKYLLLLPIQNPSTQLLPKVNPKYKRETKLRDKVLLAIFLSLCLTALFALFIYMSFSYFQPYSPKLDAFVSNRSAALNITYITLTVINLQSDPVFITKVILIDTELSCSFDPPIKIDPYATTNCTMHGTSVQMPSLLTFKIYDVGSFPRLTVPRKNAS